VGQCTYVFNPSEIYQRTKPGQGVETVCGARTFPAVDDPEIVPVRVQTPGLAEVQWSYLPTGKMTARSQDDPYCPAHGGSAEPPPPPVTLADLQMAHDAYLQLAARFDHGGSDQPALEGVALPGLPPPPAGDGEQVTAGQLAAAAKALRELADQVPGQPEEGAVSGE
jgi:hypothetical protein